MAKGSRRSKRKRAGKALFQSIWSHSKLGTIVGGLLVLSGGWWYWTKITPSWPISVQRWVTIGLQEFGFRLGEVTVFGRSRTTQTEVLKALNVKQGDFLLGLNLPEMRTRLLDLPWIKEASLHRALSGGLYVYLVEREPIAVYHDAGKKKFFLVDSGGGLVDQPIQPCFRGLPVISGEKAFTTVGPMLQLLREFPALRSNLSALVWIHERRWNIRLSNNLKIKLPESNLRPALEILETLVKAGKTSSGDVQQIDLRLADRIVLKLTPGGKAYFETLRKAKRA